MSKKHARDENGATDVPVVQTKKKVKTTEEPLPTSSNKASTAFQSESKRHNHTDSQDYLPGFGGHFESEALPNALPVGQNTPQKCPYGLIAEQLSGTSFTTPRVKNQRSWLYRILPTAHHEPMKKVDNGLLWSDWSKAELNPNQFRWSPFALPASHESKDFIQGLISIGGTGSPEAKSGFGVHIYTCNKSMENRSFTNSDGDLLIVPQLGELRIQTEFGWLKVQPGFICVIQRGMKFSVFISEASRGYVCEVYNGHFVIPDLGPIGANGLANPRDFLHPKAAWEQRKCKYTTTHKFCGDLWEGTQDHSPYDVVAWHGNYVPYMYDLAKFVTVNSVSVDHLDPSIFTVLTCPTTEPGVACLDFVIFPPRWAVQEHTFRPPYYHRNCMSEFMGNIMGQYDAKPEGFMPGGASLHSSMMGHGPDADAFAAASNAELKPHYMDGQLAFMFESTYTMRVTPWALQNNLDKNYYQCWQKLKPTFDQDKMDID